MGVCGETETALSFGDPRSEFCALRTDAGVFDLSTHAKIIASGRDRVRWLNGMVTNNIRDLADNRGVYNFLLTPQGRIQGDLYVYRRGEQFVLDIEREQAARILELLRKYIIMDQVELTPADDKLTAIGVVGPRSAEVVRSNRCEVSNLEPLQVQDCGECIAVRRPAEFGEGFELWTTPNQAPALWQKLVAAGATPVGAEALERYRIARGIPRVGPDIRERELPQETGQMRALNFTKGCYIGQEIVERIRSRGAVHRQFTGFVVEGDPPAAGTKVQADGKEVGEITSAASVQSSTGLKSLALGYVRREAGAAGTAVDLGGVQAVVSALPFTV